MAKDARQLKLKCNKFARKRTRDNLPRKVQKKRTSFFNTAGDSEYTVELEDNATKEVRTTTLKIFQINNQKRIMSTEETSRHVSRLNNFCVMGTEPSTNGFNITGLNRTHKLFQAAVDKPRAYIYCHRGINAWPSF